MEKLSKALDVVKQKKAALDAAADTMQKTMEAQQKLVDAASDDHRKAVETAKSLHDEFQDLVSALLPGHSRVRSA